MPEKAYRNQRTGRDGWYTPPLIIEAVREVFSDAGIELDPASSETAQQVVQAKRYYTAEDDALDKEWKASTVFMNPPYTRKVIDMFVDKLIHHFECDDIQQAIVLTNNSTETEWWQKLANDSAYLFFPKGRIEFWSETPDETKPGLQGQSLFYFGDKWMTFRNVMECKVDGLGVAN